VSARDAAADQLAALQQALSAEHAAVYGYGIAGGRLTGAEETAAAAAFATHEGRRDIVARLIRDNGGTPVAALPAYRPRTPVTDRRSALRLAVAMEEDCAAAYVGVLGTSEGQGLRRSAAAWLADAAVRDQQWRVRLGAAALGAMPPLPGLVLPVPSPFPSATPGVTSS
jgi:hypothetical protein